MADRKINWTNWIMLIVMVGLGCFYYLHDGGGGPQTGPTPGKAFFPNLKMSDIVALKVERLKESAGVKPFVHEITLKNTIWTLQGAEPMALRTLTTAQGIKSLVELEKDEEISGEGINPKPEEFGVDKPTFKLTLTDKNSKQHSFMLGDKTPDDQGYYAITGPGQPIYAIKSTLAELTESNPDAMRETSPITFESSLVNKIQVESQAGPPLEMVLSKPREDAGGEEMEPGMSIQDLNEEWKITKPEAVAADPDKVRGLVASWKAVKVGRFMKASEAMDLSKPTVKLTFWVDRASDPFTLTVGSAVPGKNNLYYAERSHPPEKMVLEINDYKLLEPKQRTVQQMHLYTFQPEDVKKLVATIEGTRIEATKSDSDWSVKEPKVPGVKAEDQGAALNDLVWEVKNMEWLDQPKNPPNAWKERASIELFGEKGKSLGKILLGQGGYIRNDKNVDYRIEKDPMPRWKDIVLRLQGKGPKPTATPAANPIVLPH